MERQKFCSACGQPFGEKDSFCESCGEKRKEEIGTKSDKTKGLGKKGMAVIAIVVIAIGTITGFSLFGNSLTLEGVIRDTLALESGKIEISYSMESDYYDDDDSIEFEFLKNSEEKTFLVEAGYESVYASAKDGRVLVINGWGEEEFDFEDEFGLDVNKLEKDLIDYFAKAFKGQKVPEGYIKDIKVEKESGLTIISGDIKDETGLIKWAYDRLDLGQLKKIVLANISKDNEAKDFLENGLDDETDEMDEAIEEIEYELEDYDIDSSFKISVDKNGILEEASIVFEVEESDYDDAFKITINLELTDKNDIDSIKKP